MTRVLVCGGRGFNDRDALHRAMLKHIPGVEVRPTSLAISSSYTARRPVRIPSPPNGRSIT